MFVLFFVRVPPLGWLGVFIIVLFFVLRATTWLARGYDYCSFFVCVLPLGWLGDIIIVFIIVIERARFPFCFVSPVWVCLMFYKVGFDSRTKLASGDPLVYW